MGAREPQHEPDLEPPVDRRSLQDRAPELPAPSSPVLALQRAAGNRAVTRMLAFDAATSGPAAEVPRRAEMEAAFGTSFAGVRAHLGGPGAEAGLDSLHARAATRGSDVAFREASPPADLVAHELAHVVQQRRGASGVACAPERPGPASPAERAAEAAASAVAAGRPVPDVGAAGAGEIQLAPVVTAGGEWDTTTYLPFHTGDDIGADIDINFTPKDPVVADHIGLTQSVKTLRSTSAGGAVDDPSFVGARNTALSLGAGASDPGRAIDQGDPGGAGDTLPNTSPFYAVENTPGHVAATLGDVAPTAAFGSHASRVRQADGTFVETPGNLVDHPRRHLAFAGQEWQQTFEVTALAIDGPLANMYMGSVEWGWTCDAGGAVSVDPLPIRVVREGAPTAAFMDAARLWNAATFTDPSDAASYDTVDLPIEGVDPGAMTTPDLLARLNTTRTAAASAAAADAPRRQFEALALERELRKRKINVELNCHSISDTGGAAMPAEDEVWLELDGGGGGLGMSLTGTRTFRAGDAHTYEFPVGDFMPLSGPIHIEVQEHDRAGTRSAAHDDLLISIDWSPPFAAVSVNDAGNHYTARVTFDR